MKRIEFMDIARGIGILLVAFGHIYEQFMPLFVLETIYSFHMPLFFFLSGYLFHPNIPFAGFIKRKFNSLLKPYFFVVFLIYFVTLSFSSAGTYESLRWILRSFYGTGSFLERQWLPLWFLPHLFAVNVFAYLLEKARGIIKYRLLYWASLVIMLFVGVSFINRFYPFYITISGTLYDIYTLPFGIDIILVSGFFFIAGREIRDALPETTFQNIWLLPASFAGLIALNIFFAANLDLFKRIYQSFLVNTAESVCGIVFVLCLSKQIELRMKRLSSVLIYIGQASLAILIFHLPIQSVWMQRIFSGTDNVYAAVFFGFAAGIIGPLILHEIFIRKNPVALFWFGEKARSEK